MKEIIEKWTLFVTAQKLAEKKVEDRMELWDKENEVEYSLSDYNYSYSFHEMKRNMEKTKLNKEFDVVDVTFENFLTSQIKHD